MSAFGMHHDPGDESEPRLDPIEVPPDEIHLEAGMHSIGHYIKQQEIDGDERIALVCYTQIEYRGLILLRSERLRRALESEITYQKVIGSEGGIL